MRLKVVLLSQAATLLLGPVDIPGQLVWEDTKASDKNPVVPHYAGVTGFAGIVLTDT